METNSSPSTYTWLFGTPERIGRPGRSVSWSIPSHSLHDSFRPSSRTTTSPRLAGWSKRSGDDKPESAPVKSENIGPAGHKHRPERLKHDQEQAASKPNDHHRAPLGASCLNPHSLALW